MRKYLKFDVCKINLYALQGEFKEVEVEGGIYYRNRSTYLFKSGFDLNLNRFDARSCIQALSLQNVCATFVTKLWRQSSQT